MASGSVPPGVAPTPLPPGASAPPPAANLQVDLPAGGRLTLQNAEEVAYWNDNAQRYIANYGLQKANDLVFLGAILGQGIAMFRAQMLLSDPKRSANAISQMSKASEEIVKLEKVLGIDKKTREQGGQHTTADYVTNLKRAAHMMGVRIAERTKAYEAFVQELTWRIRLLRNGDDEDRAYHNLSEASVVSWAETEIAKLTDSDKDWAHQKGKVFVGKL